MLKYPCLVLDHDDTVVQSETSINYPFFCYILDVFRPGTKVTMEQYVEGCFHLGFAQMCRQWYQFSEQELVDEYRGWMDYVKTHIPPPYPGIKEIIHHQKAEGGLVCVVSHSSVENITRDYEVHFQIQPDAIYGWDLPEEKRKPNPYPLEDIMRRYGLQPSQLLVVDDMKPAWEMSHRVNAPIAFAAWGRKDFPECAKEMRTLCDFSFDTTELLAEFLFK